MKKSKFLTLLHTLSKTELADFSKYLKRLHLNDHAPLAVFDYVQKFHPEFSDDKKLDIGYAYQRIFKHPLAENKANRTKILNALSDLHLWLREFLLLEKVKGDSFESQSFWMSILKERGLVPEFSRKAELLQQTVEKMPKASVSDYMKGMASNYLYYYHLTRDKQRENIPALKDCGKNLDLFYAVIRLKIACEVASRQRLISEKADLEPLPAIIELYKAHPIADHPLLALYLKVYELISSQQASLFSDIESILRDSSGRIDPEEIHTILGYLHNYLASQLRRDDDSHLAMTHNLNKFAVEHQVLSKSGGISPNHFANIVTVACNANDLAWAEAFIEDCQHLLLAEIMADAAALAKAIVLFEKKEFDEVLIVLRNVVYHDLLYAIRAKSLTLRSQYELAGDDKSSVMDCCLAFEAFLKRHRNPKREAVEATLNFLAITKKLAAGNTKKEAILEMIQRASPIYHKSWLVGKASSRE